LFVCCRLNLYGVQRKTEFNSNTNTIER